MAKLIKDSKHEGMYYFWCEGCKCKHYIATGNNDCGFPIWKWNGNIEKPTIFPSIKVESFDGKPTVCHSFINDGKIKYLSDCTHELANKTVDLKNVGGE